MPWLTIWSIILAIPGTVLYAMAAATMVVLCPGSLWLCYTMTDYGICYTMAEQLLIFLHVRELNQVLE